MFFETDSSNATGEDVEYEYRIIAANGRVHWFHDRGCLIRDNSGSITHRQGVIFDITAQKQADDERRKAEADLGESETRYRSLFENANDIIYVHDLEGNYLSINQAGERAFGYTREEVLRLNLRSGDDARASGACASDACRETKRQDQTDRLRGRLPDKGRPSADT